MGYINKILLLSMIACSSPRDIEIFPIDITLPYPICVDFNDGFLAKNERVEDLFYFEDYFFALTNYNYLYQISEKEIVKRFTVGEVVLDGKGKPKMWPGGQIVKTWENSGDIVLFNTVPFELHVFRNGLMSPEVIGVKNPSNSDKFKDKYKVLDVISHFALISQERYGENTVFFHLLDIRNEEFRFLFSKEMGDKTFHFMGRFIGNEVFYFLDSLGKSIIFFDFTGKVLKEVTVPLEFDRAGADEEESFDVRIRDVYVKNENSFFLIKEEKKKKGELKWFFLDSEAGDMNELKNVKFAKFDKGNILTFESSGSQHSFVIQPID